MGLSAIRHSSFESVAREVVVSSLVADPRSYMEVGQMISSDELNRMVIEISLG